MFNHWKAPRLPYINPDWIVVVLAMALMIYIGVNAAMTGTPAVSMPENLAFAAPANQQPVVPNLAPARPATPTVAPTVEPTRAPLPLVEVEWTLVENIPANIAYLWIQDGILYAVQDMPGGCSTWSYKNGVWSGRPATDKEVDAARTRDWTDFRSLVEDTIGAPPEGEGAIVVGSDSFGIAAHTFEGIFSTHLYLKIEKGWVEILPPAGRIINLYGFVRLGNTLYAALQIVDDGTVPTMLWQAQLENPSP